MNDVQKSQEPQEAIMKKENEGRPGSSSDSPSETKFDFKAEGPPPRRAPMNQRAPRRALVMIQGDRRKKIFVQVGQTWVASEGEAPVIRGVEN